MGCGQLPQVVKKMTEALQKQLLVQLAAAASTKPSRVRAEEPGPADWARTPLSRVQVPQPQSRWKSRVWPSARSETT